MREYTKAPDIEAWAGAGSDELEAALRDRPDVLATAQYAWMFVYPVRDGALPPEGMYVALSDTFGTDIAVPRIVAGRAADPARADEMTINEAFAELLDLRVGDRIELRSNPDVVVQAATVVGIHRGTRDLNQDAGLGSALLTPAFGRRWFEPYRDAWATTNNEGYPRVVSARFVPGTDLDQVIAELRRQFPDQVPERVDNDSVALSDALSAQRTAYTLLAVIGGVGALAALGQAMSRRIRRSSDELAVLSVLGLSRPERMIAVLGAPLVASAAGAMAAPAVAYAGSGIVPRGLAHRVDPTPGRHVDWLVGIVGAGAAVVLLALVGTAVARRATIHQQAPATAGRRRSTIAHPARLFGLRVAGGWATRANRATARSQLAGLIGATALVAAVATWSAAAHHISAHPQLWGKTWDATVEINEKKLSTTTDLSGQDLWPMISSLGDRLTTNDALVAAIAAVQDGSVTIGGHQLEAEVIDTRRGTVWPPLVRGRDARAPDEINASEGIAARAGWKLNSSITVGTTSVRLVGEVVVPQFGTGEFGQTVLMSPAALERIGGFDIANSAYLFINLAPGATRDDLAAVIGDQFDILEPFPPSPVLGVRSIGGVDTLLLAFIAAISVAALIHGVRGAARQRRRDHAVMRALGARSRLVASATAWHTAFILGTGALVGIPVGWILGRLVWSRTATGMGVVVDYPSPVPMLATIVVSTIVVGSLIASGLGAVAANRSSTRSLSQE